MTAQGSGNGSTGRTARPRAKPDAPTSLDPALEARVEEIVARKFAELVESNLTALTAAKSTAKPERKRRRLALVASKGTLDMAYPPLILASTAGSMGWEVGVFFTFYGLDIINKKRNKHLQVAPVGNPAMPVPVPNLVGAIPGMTAMATRMMKGWMDAARMPSIDELIDVCRMTGVKMIACSTTMGVMKVSAEDIMDGMEIGGAAAFLDFAADADVSLFV
ncbi:MAG TPA: DsrE/DsrF/DrsH-like family protein [Dehalococcoidia bacterium]|nr:DsrE/DsrF/DrsH-like family protein [Dehalococcoidia bacterium]